MIEMTKKIHYISMVALAMIAAATVLFSCKGKPKEDPGREIEGVRVVLPDTLRVGMLNSPTTYFDYRGDTLGYDYELMEKFARQEDLKWKLMVGGTISEMLEWLDKGEIDILASPVPVTSEFQDRAILCGPKMVSCQVLVQKAGDDKITDVTQLVGREVDVQEDSKYYYRMMNLNDELGGGIEIKALKRDTVSDDDLLSMVYKGEIPMTVVDSDVAEAALSFYPGLDISVKVSMDQYSRWAVSSQSEALGEILDRWAADEKNGSVEIFKKYYRLSKADIVNEEMMPIAMDLKNMTFAGGRISPYDELFKSYAGKSGLDWRLVAAVAYVESHFKADAHSWAGAKGIMQIMPRTARSLGVDPSRLSEPSVSIDLAVKVLKTLDSNLASKVSDPQERMKFVLASYNSGNGHINDAIALAGKYGMDPQVWEGNVEKAALMKSNPAYYRDPVVKNGYFRGRETVQFVKKVNAVYEVFKKNVS